MARLDVVFGLRYFSEFWKKKGQQHEEASGGGSGRHRPGGHSDNLHPVYPL
jgi:hypothetical protein